MIRFLLIVGCVAFLSGCMHPRHFNGGGYCEVQGVEIAPETSFFKEWISYAA